MTTAILNTPYAAPKALTPPPNDDAVTLLVADTYATALGDILVTVEPDSGRRVDLHKPGEFHWVTRCAHGIVVDRAAVWAEPSSRAQTEPRKVTVWIENVAHGTWWTDSATNAVVY
ncbi:hypothetical protein [Corynebacterium sp. H113]|uniref:hypothetical protein n=1 Tax=Corynebacterium sp. H113 TaxID=3133419 RepID=UPI0030976C1D